jgi:hypothetical protein
MERNPPPPKDVSPEPLDAAMRSSLTPTQRLLRVFGVLFVIR